MKKGLHPQQKFGSVDLLLRLYLCKKMLTMTSHFKLPLIGNISFFPKPNYVYDGDYVWCLQLEEAGPRDLDWTFQLNLRILLKGASFCCRRR